MLKNSELVAAKKKIAGDVGDYEEVEGGVMVVRELSMLAGLGRSP